MMYVFQEPHPLPINFKIEWKVCNDDLPVNLKKGEVHMRNKGFTSKTVLFATCMMLSFLLISCDSMNMKKDDTAMGGAHAGHGMTMHHQHQMLNHALGMALQGSNLVMIGQMDMAPGLDDLTIDHGKMMLKDARAMWNETMSGDSMMKMHSSGMSPADDPAMKYTHELAEAQIKVIDLMDKHANMKGHTMGMHHQHLLLNHALEMAIEGSDMDMTGSMGMAPGVDKGAMKHGSKMIKNAEKLWNEVMSGSDMMKMHAEGMSPDKHKGMAFTHELSEAQLRVLELIKNMP